MRSVFLVFSVLFISTACNYEKQNEKTQKAIEQVVIRKTSVQRLNPDQISIYRYGNFSVEIAKKLEMYLKDYYPLVILNDFALILPAKYYDKKRNRYKGTGLFDELSKHRNSDVVIGLTDYIIFQSNEISPTYGVMGISPLGTYKCVVSSKIT